MPAASSRWASSKGDRARAGRRDRPRIRRLLLRRGLCRPVAGAAAAADQLRRPRGLCRPARRHADQQRPAAVPLSRPSSPNSPAAAADQRGVAARDWDSLADSRAVDAPTCPRADADEIAYLQYSSGSTRFPHGVAVTHRALLDNLRAHGVGDRSSATPTAACQLAALVPRHGPGRLHAVAGRQPDVASII